MSKSLKDIWYEEFNSTAVVNGTEFGGFCVLCGNSGKIDSSKFNVTSPIGLPIKPIKAFCICPNGRAIKKLDNIQKVKNEKK